MMARGGCAAEGGGGEPVVWNSSRHVTSQAAGKFKQNNEGFLKNLKSFSTDEALRGVCLAFFAPYTI